MNIWDQRDKIIARILLLTEEHAGSPWVDFAVFMAECKYMGVGWDPNVEDYLRCHTPLEKMAQLYGKSRRQIINYMNDMEAAGILIRAHEPVRGGRGRFWTQPKYILTLGLLPESHVPAKIEPAEMGAADPADLNCTPVRMQEMGISDLNCTLPRRSRTLKKNYSGAGAPMLKNWKRPNVRKAIERDKKRLLRAAL